MFLVRFRSPNKLSLDPLGVCSLIDVKSANMQMIVFKFCSFLLMSYDIFSTICLFYAICPIKFVGVTLDNT